MVHPLNVEGVDPFEFAQRAADQIAQKTSVEHHDIALTLGSGWSKAADLIGETVAEIPANDIPRRLPQARRCRPHRHNSLHQASKREARANHWCQNTLL